MSDRVLRIAALYQFDEHVLSDKESFKEWLKSSLIALGGKKHLDFIDNDTGLSMVKDLLGRTEHGVYS